MPKSTVHWWARNGILVPSVSAERVKLWSYSDLMGLRTIAWLRASKTAPDGHSVPATAMRAVRRALRELEDLDLGVWSTRGGPNVAVDRHGRIVLGGDQQPHHVDGQALLDAKMLDVLRPFAIDRLTRGPDLVAPRPRLRIVPGKLAGAPHVRETRIETQALAALGARGMGVQRIRALYPAIEVGDVEDALDLERELQPGLLDAA